MNIHNRAIKIYLKSIAPVEAHALIAKCEVPSPERECLYAMIAGKKAYAGCDYIAAKYGINIGYQTYVRRLKRGLEIMQKSVKFLSK